MANAKTVILREATPADAMAIARVHVDSWRETYAGMVPADVLTGLSYERRDAVWREAMAKGPGFFTLVLCHDQNEVVGFGFAGPERTGDPRFTGEVNAIYVLSRYQRRGYGQALMGALASSLRDAGHRSLLLWVLKVNPACQFYERLGGHLISEKEVTIGGVQLRAVSYGWDDIDVLARLESPLLRDPSGVAPRSAQPPGHRIL